MKNQEVVKMFIQGTRNHKGTKNLHIEEGKLINYYTVIGQWKDGELTINSTKYSQSTSVIQGKLRYEASGIDYKEVTGLQTGVREL